VKVNLHPSLKADALKPARSHPHKGLNVIEAAATRSRARSSSSRSSSTTTRPRHLRADEEKVGIIAEPCAPYASDRDTSSSTPKTAIPRETPKAKSKT